MRALLLLFVALSAQMVTAMDPPWYEFASRVAATLGADRCVTVGGLVEPEDRSQPFLLPVLVCNHEKAQALAQVVGATRRVAGVTIAVQISDPKGVVSSTNNSALTMDQADRVIRTAFFGNPYFLETIVASESQTLWVEFGAQVVQFPADNISNYYGQENEVAEASFAEVLDFSSFSSVVIRTTSAKHW